MKKPTLKSLLRSLAIVVIALAVVLVIIKVKAGTSLDPTDPPTAPTMKTLDEIYCKLTGCTPAAPSLDPTGPPAPTMHNLEDIYNETPNFKDNPGTALESEVKTDQTFYTNSGTKLTGSGTKTLSVANDIVAAGYYEATTLSGVDADLAVGNIKSGVTIFGIAGDTNVVDTSSGDAISGDIKSSRKAWVDGSEVEGTATIVDPEADGICFNTQSIWDCRSGATNLQNGNDFCDSKGMLCRMIIISNSNTYPCDRYDICRTYIDVYGCRDVLLWYRCDANVVCNEGYRHAASVMCY